MIVKVTMFACNCDNCSRQFVEQETDFVAFTDEDGIKESVGEDEDWYSEDGKHYCPSCLEGLDATFINYEVMALHK